MWTVHNIWSDRWFSISVLQEFEEDLFNGMDVESTLGKAEVWSRHAIVTVRKGHNFWSDRWISI